MTNVKYSIEKHDKLGDKVKGHHVLWQTAESERGYCVRGIFHGTKKECEEKLKEIKNDKNTQ
jgi:hypothetical protein